MTTVDSVDSIDCYNCGRPIPVTASGCRVCGSAIIRRNIQEKLKAQRQTGPIKAVVQHEYAGIFVRFLAYLLDGFILVALSWLILFQTGLVDLESRTQALLTEEDPAVTIALLDETITMFTLTSLAVGVVYSTILLALTGRTLAAFVFRIKVVDSMGGRISPVAALVRSLAANWSSVLFAIGLFGGVPILVTLSGYAGMLVTLGYAWAIWDSENQTLHDKFAGTIVVKG